MAHSLKIDQSGGMTDILCLECGRHWRMGISEFERIFDARTHVYDLKSFQERHRRFSDWIHEYGKLGPKKDEE